MTKWEIYQAALRAAVKAYNEIIVQGDDRKAAQRAASAAYHAISVPAYRAWAGRD
jgi:hypothetical protein